MLVFFSMEKPYDCTLFCVCLMWLIKFKQTNKHIDDNDCLSNDNDDHGHHIDDYFDYKKESI